jgi:hypothetical protein
MPINKRIALRSVGTQTAGHDARALAAAEVPNTGMSNRWNVASARMRRAQRAVMSPTQFLTLAAGWSAGLVLLLIISAVARYLS